MIRPANPNMYPIVGDFFLAAPYSEVTLMEGTSLTAHQQFCLQDAIMIRDIEDEVSRKVKTEAVAGHGLGKKLGVYVDGKLRLQTRDADAAYEYAGRRMREKHSVWVAPVGSFVTA